jgi:hypothetical protein
MSRTVRLLVTIELDGDDDRSAEQVRADIEREPSPDLADVDLLANSEEEGIDATTRCEHVGERLVDDQRLPLRIGQHPAAFASAAGEGRDPAAYVAAVSTALMRQDPALLPYLSPICPECDQEPDPEDGVHVVLSGAVVIGCEDYWVINPNVLAIPSPTWQPRGQG